LGLGVEGGEEGVPDVVHVAGEFCGGGFWFIFFWGGGGVLDMGWCVGGRGVWVLGGHVVYMRLW
jgi:hypothetical protein